MSRPENSEREALVEHERSKERVGKKIGASIKRHLDALLGLDKGRSLYGHTFRLMELETMVRFEHESISPGSVSRIMRDMRQKGIINYELVSRHKSLYRALPLDSKEPL